MFLSVWKELFEMNGFSFTFVLLQELSELDTNS